MTRRPLNKLFRRAVQCRDQSVVNRLHDRSHPNKVSMKKKRERVVGGKSDLFILFDNRASAKRDCGTANQDAVCGSRDKQGMYANTANIIYNANIANMSLPHRSGITANHVL